MKNSTGHAGDMMTDDNGAGRMIAFGPVPSRRLGHSLGINNIPPKICSYSCIYCQVGRTIRFSDTREEFYRPEEICSAVGEKIDRAKDLGEQIDYLTFVPDGEPTLDIRLGEHIESLRIFDLKIAVISNASLIWREDVRDELGRADWVSLKVDAATEGIWHKINRPHRSLKFDEIKRGMADFSRSFSGELVTETMLVDDINDRTEEMESIANFISTLGPKRSYISIPIRPPAEKRVEPPGEDVINTAYQVFDERSLNAEYLIGYEGNEFAFTGDAQEDLLSITSVHPMRKDAVGEYLKKAGEDWGMIDGLVASGALRELEYGGDRFYVRRITGSRYRDSGHLP